MEKSNLEILKEKVRTKRMDWGGDKLIYGTVTYNMNKKLHEVTEEEATKIINYMGIGKDPNFYFGGDPCQCGCGGNARTGRRFIPGHDAKLKSKLLKTMRKGGREGKKAEKELIRLKWV